MRPAPEQPAYTSNLNVACPVAHSSHAMGAATTTCMEPMVVLATLPAAIFNGHLHLRVAEAREHEVVPATVMSGAAEEEEDEDEEA